jgi:microcystin-dependent protein
MAEPFLGQINIFPYNFAPRGWAFCQGQLLSIAQNTALFALIGTTYGGNGQTTFALPDLRGRAALGAGQGPGLSMYDLGEVTGSESVTLTINTMAAHGHPFQLLASETDANSKSAINAFFCNTASNFYQTAQDGTKMGLQNTGLTGGSQPFSILQPYLCLNFCIATEGVFPSRN